ncbi:MAG: putative DNA binding domain-containing protein [Anaerolineae bacterium]|nr:putative DNA binding domain-containing protein [Anaerolineae bacterium]
MVEVNKMDEAELLNLFLYGETDRVEHKERFYEAKDKICQTICAFANDLPNHNKPSVVFIGQKDDGTCANMTIDTKLLEDIASIRNEGKILPFPTMEVQKHTLNGCDVVAIIVHPSENTPIFYTDDKRNNHIWVRVGPSTRKATRSEETTLTRKRKYVEYDVTPVRQATLSDLNLIYLHEIYIPRAVSPEILEENDRPIEHQLSALHLSTPDGIPTVTGLLVAGNTIRYFLPDVYIQFVRYPGDDIGGITLDDQQIDGRLDDMIKNIMDKIRVNITTQTNIMTSDKSIVKQDYPLEALRQLVINAILHRDYEMSRSPIRVVWFDDRIEIISPGGLEGTVNKENFGQPYATYYRNPNLATVMKTLKHVEQFGAGIRIARKLLHENGNPPPEFNLDVSNFVIVTVRKAT